MLSLIFPAMLTLGGSLFLVIAWRAGGQTLRILKTGNKTQGIVIENALRPTRTGERTKPTARAPVVQFKTESGDAITFYSTDYTTPARYEIEQIVEIWYLPNDPQQASLDGGEVWILPAVFGTFGGVMCLIGLPWLLRVLFKF